MTREEAIRKLQKQKAEYLEEWVDFSGVAEAYDMAIEALEQPIIRCKDCKHKNVCFSEVAMTNKYQTTTLYEPIEWCSKAERKEE